MKYLILSIVCLLFFLACKHGVNKNIIRPKDTTAKSVHDAKVVHYPKVVYNSCSDEYAVLTDSLYGIPMFFGQLPPAKSDGLTPFVVLTWGGFSSSLYSNESKKILIPRPPLVTITFLHDTMQFTQPGGEFQFKDSAMALRSYLSFVKECGDSEEIQNRPIRKKIREMDIADSIQAIKDSIFNSRKRIEDSIFKCLHTYN